MGRKPKVTRETLLASALSIVDSEGLEALTMRRLGEALGVEAMSLYRHVANKDALLDAVHEAVLVGLRAPRRTGDWAADARALARAFRRALLAHPNAVLLFATRPAVGHGSLEVVETTLALLEAPFPSLAQRVRVLQCLVAYVVGSVLTQRAAVAEVAALRYADLPPGAFPNLTRAGAVMARYSQEREFELGLDALLAGFARL